MRKLFFVHWNGLEALTLAEPLANHGFDVVIHTEPGKKVESGVEPIDVAVVSLDRLPSHGRAMADWLITSKKTRVVFVSGDPCKLEQVSTLFPTMQTCDWDELMAVLLSPMLVHE